jgi:uncharacterized protein
VRRLLLTAGLLLAGLAAAAPFRAPPPPSQWVTDSTGLLSEGVRASLNQRLQRYQRDTGHQVVVWVGENQGDATLEEWAARTFEAWGLGQKGKDDGVGIFVFPRERRLRIEVGYGLEGDLPDAIANRILDEQVIPLLKAGQPDAAITAAVDQVLRTLGGERAGPGAVAQPERGLRGPSHPLSPGRLLFYGIVGLVLLVLFITNPRLGMLLLWSIFSGGRGGGWGGGGGGGGGFGGGGGRSGGGGASGSW